MEQLLCWMCPRCLALVFPPNEAAKALLKASGLCHKCRLERTLSHLLESGNTTLLTDVLRFTGGYAGFRYEAGFSAHAGIHGQGCAPRDSASEDKEMIQ